MTMTEILRPDLAWHGPIESFPVRVINQSNRGIEMMSCRSDASHEKTDLKVFFVVIPKEGMTPTFQNLTLLTS